jgi:hypothetical protein
METANPSEPSQRSPQDTAREFEALWAQSRLRAKFRRGLSLEELKDHSSRLRRMAQQGAISERGAGSR